MRGLGPLAIAFALVTMGFAGHVAADEVEGPGGIACANPTGDAACKGVAASGAGNATAEGFHDVGASASGTGDAATTHEGQGVVGVAASGTGNAIATSADGAAVAASGTGDAAASSLLSLAVAASGTGNATAFTLWGDGAAAASGTGDSHAKSWDSGDALVVAASGTGNATAHGGHHVGVSGCEAVDDAVGSDAACQDGELGAVLP